MTTTKLGDEAIVRLHMETDHATGISRRQMLKLASAWLRNRSGQARLGAVLVAVVAVVLAACGTDDGAVSAPSTVDAAAGNAAGEPSPTISIPPTPAPRTPAEGSLASDSDQFHLAFDGLDDRVLVPWDASFPTEVFTASAWIRLPEPPPRRAAIVARGEDDNSFNLSWQLYVGPAGDLEVMLEASNEDNYCYPDNNCVPLGVCQSGDTFVADNAWHHVAVTRDRDGTLVFYIDGRERARCAGTGTPSSNNQQFLSIGATHGAIGRLPAGGTEPPIWFFPGEIDDPAMWNRSLPAIEIEALARDGVDLTSPGLVGFWSLDEGQGQDVHDGSPAANHGYLGAHSDPDSADPVWIQ